MNFQIGSLFVKVTTRLEHISISLVLPVGNNQVMNIKFHTSSEEGTNPLTGTLRVYVRGDKREEQLSLDI